MKGAKQLGTLLVSDSPAEPIVQLKRPPLPRRLQVKHFLSLINCVRCCKLLTKLLLHHPQHLYFGLKTNQIPPSLANGDWNGCKSARKGTKRVPAKGLIGIASENAIRVSCLHLIW